MSARKLRESDTRQSAVRRSVKEATDGRSAILYSIKLNIRAFMPHQCVSCVPQLRAKEETLWLGKSAKSSHEVTADGSSGST